MSRIPYDVDALGASQEEVAARLKVFRLEQHISLRTFADRVTGNGRRISHTAVAKYESGQLKITPDYLEAVAEAFGLSYGWLLSGVDEDHLCADHPSLITAGLAGLPPYAHEAVSSRLEGLAKECGFPDGPEREEFFQTVGGLILAPFLNAERLIRGWDEMTQKELMGYLTGKFVLLRTLLRKPSVVEVPAPKPAEVARIRRRDGARAERAS